MGLKISDKLAKVDSSLTINMYDNGFMLEVCGRDEDEEYKTAKIMCGTVEELQELLGEAVTMERDE